MFDPSLLPIPPSATISAGAAWYPRCLETVASLAPGVPVARAVGAFSLLSPQVTYTQNIACLRQLVAGSKVSHFHKQAAAAARVLRGETTLEEETKGPKLRAFARAILGDLDAVVVDRWAIRPWGNMAVTAARYRAAEQAYREVAAELGIPARDYQAAVWIQLRGSET